MSFSMTHPNWTAQQSVGLCMRRVAATSNTTTCFIFYASYYSIFNEEIYNALFNLIGFWRLYSHDWNCQHRSLSQAKLQNNTRFLRPDKPPSSGRKLRTYCGGTVRNSRLFPGRGPSKYVLPSAHSTWRWRRIKSQKRGPPPLRRWIKPQI